MPRPSKKEKKDQAPLVIHEKSMPFYKAFLFPEQNPDMIVDTSGDTFSSTPENALLALFESLSNDVIDKIPMRELFFMDEPVEHDESNTSPYAKNVVMIRITANWDEELKNAKSDGGAHDFIVAIRDLHDGYTTSLQDYEIKWITLKSNSKENFTWHLERLHLAVPDKEKMSPLFPEEIRIP